MTPAARLSAAIEVLAEIEAQRRPAADALKAWGLAHRFAGSGDRAAIAGIVYDTLRGAPLAPRVEHGDSQSTYVLVEVAVPPGAERITLKMDDEPEQALTLSPDGFVNFVALRKKLVQSRDTRIEYSMLGKETRLPIVFR